MWRRCWKLRSWRKRKRVTVKKSRSREKERGDRRRRSRSRSKDKERRRRSRSRDKRERRSSSKTRDRHRRRHSRSPEEFKSRRDRRRDRRRSRSRSPRRDLAPEERDMRTVFCMQLAARITSRELEEFFSAVGKVREVRLIMDNKTRRHKGIAYIEYHEINSVSLALALNGHKLCGVPIVIQPTQAEKNRAAASAAAAQRGIAGPLRLYVGSLHFNITEDMLRGIFEPFGRIDKIELQRDDSGRSKGFGFITFFESEDAKKALEQLNGFELAGRAMKVNYVTERTDSLAFQNQSGLDSDDLDRSGIELGTTGRLQLMAKLAEGTGIKLPQAAINALSMGQAVAAMPPNVAQTASAAAAQLAGNGASVATPCFMLTNMFDPDTESDSNWPTEIRNDVLEECEKHGGALHVFVDPKSQGNVYVKCPTATIASGCVKSLHGRFFAGRTVTAAYVPVVHYHSLFPDSVNVSSPI